MKKQFTIILILTFILGLTPINFSTAITQNQIDAEVQIVCTDGNDNWFSGSGTIIDPSGIILTNRHVIEGAYLNTCFIGFIESINQEPNFGTEGNYNLAEVKYKTTSSDMDAAILYLDNPSNKIYPYINIWDSNSGNLQLGDDLEAIGFPGIGGSTITYTSGDFSGFGSSSDGTQNYIKTTAILEHGNSGGAAYNSNGQFIGIPTMVVSGTLNSLGYILSVNSIKSWLSGILGTQYKNEVIKQTPVVVEPTVNIQNDITPPKMSSSGVGIYLYDENENFIQYTDSKLGQGGIYRYPKVSFGWYQNCVTNEYGYITGTCVYDKESNVSGYYYYFGPDPKAIPEKDGTYIAADNLSKDTIYSNANKNMYGVTGYENQRKLAVIFEASSNAPYYFILQAVDSSNNISNALVRFEYIYEKDLYKSLTSINFFTDSSMKKPAACYERKEDSDDNILNELHCRTRLNSLTINWKYKDDYNQYIVKNFNSWRPLAEITYNGEIVEKNKYTIENLKNGNNIKDKGKYYELYLKPYSNNAVLSEDHKIADIIYDPTLNSDIECEASYTFNRASSCEANNSSNNQSELKKRLSGYILLQVQENGEAYYVYPDDSKKYYLGRPDDAFSVMRQLGLGATHDFISGHVIFPASVSGKILLDVEQNGEAYYIYPKDKKAYYLGRPADAFRIMRELGLGITNSDLNRISEGSL
jgi:hypothetical protein